MKTILAIDVDIGRIHAYSNTKGRICYNAPDFPWEEMEKHDLVLIECASPLVYSKGKGELYHRLRWIIYNSMAVGRVKEKLPNHNILVSPSSAWTLGYSEEARNQMAGADGDNHDIRQCRCMIKFYSLAPDKWYSIKLFGEQKGNGSDNKASTSRVGNKRRSSRLRGKRT